MKISFHEVELIDVHFLEYVCCVAGAGLITKMEETSLTTTKIWEKEREKYSQVYNPPNTMVVESFDRVANLYYLLALAGFQMFYCILICSVKIKYRFNIFFYW